MIESKNTGFCAPRRRSHPHSHAMICGRLKEAAEGLFAESQGKAARRSVGGAVFKSRKLFCRFPSCQIRHDDVGEQEIDVAAVNLQPDEQLPITSNSGRSNRRGELRIR